MSIQEDSPRKEKPIIFMIANSGSMGYYGSNSGPRIASINAAVREALSSLREISKHKEEDMIKVAAVEFSSGLVEWMYNELLDVEAFQWQDLQSAGFVGSFGDACEELYWKLSHSGWFTDPKVEISPTIILFSAATPSDYWERGLGRLLGNEEKKGNPWFKKACKIAIRLGRGEKDALAAFTGNINSVVSVYNEEQLKKTIKLVCEKAILDDVSTQKLVDVIYDDLSLIGVDFGASEDHEDLCDWVFDW